MSQIAAERAAARRRRMMEASSSRMALVTGQINTTEFISTLESTQPKSEATEQPSLIDKEEADPTSIVDNSSREPSNDDTSTEQNQNNLPKVELLSLPPTKTQDDQPSPVALTTSPKPRISVVQPSPVITLNPAHINVIKCTVFCLLVILSCIPFPGNYLYASIITAPFPSICLFTALLELSALTLAHISGSGRRSSRPQSPTALDDIIPSQIARLLEAQSTLLPMFSAVMYILAIVTRISQFACVWITTHIALALICQ